MNKQTLLIPIVLLGGSMLSACDESGGSLPQQRMSVDLGIPDSMTGGVQPEAAKQLLGSVPRSAESVARGSSVPCAYLGVDEDEDIFRNGYESTKFMVSAVAAWSCIADLLIDVAAVVPHNGLIYETDNDNNAADYDSDEPTHYSVNDESASQTTVRLYYNYSRSAPPISGEVSHFYISWNQAEDGSTAGRMIIDGNNVNPDDHDPDDPVNMRMDFNFSQSAESSDMFLQFDDNNEWADGFRIQVEKNLAASPLQTVFVARGMINMKAQFLPVAGITEVPDVQVYAVSDSFGNGASIAEFQQLSLPLELNASTGNHLGDYLFTRTDIYYFEDDMDWDYINKTVTFSEYRGGRTTPLSGGSWLPFDPSLDQIISGLELDPGYFSGSQCALQGDDCNDLMNAINDSVDGFAGTEQNQGSDPQDWRSDALAGADYLSTVYPNGIDWNNAFEQSFNPVLP